MEAQPKGQPSVAACVAMLARLSVQTTDLEPTDTPDSVPAVVTVDSTSASAIRHTFFYGGADTSLLGAAVRWAAVQNADTLHILSEEGAGNDIARRLCHLNTGFKVSAWRLVDSFFAELEPSMVLPVPELPVDHLAFAEVIRAAGADPIDDHGRLIAEVSGLEVARVSEGPASDGLTGVRLELGVGQADRELHQLIHGPAPMLQHSSEGMSGGLTAKPGAAGRNGAAENLPQRDDLLARLTVLVEDVKRMRVTGGVEHPLARMGRQRRIRSLIVDNPALVNARSLQAVPPLRPRETVLGNDASAAVGETQEGEPLVVVCSAGVDLDLAAEAGDYRHRFDENAHLRIVTPERDLYLVEPVLLDLLADVSVVPAPES